MPDYYEDEFGGRGVVYDNGRLPDWVRRRHETPETRIGQEWVRPASRHFPNYTPEERPYSYSEFFLVGNRDDVQQPTDEERANGVLPINADYSDRLFQWKPEQHDEIWKRHLSRGYKSPSHEIEAFLKEYYDNPDLKLIAVAEGCNVSNGYPYWIVWYTIGAALQAKNDAEETERRKKHEAEMARIRREFGRGE